ncbi:UNVERIFIED_CONTAM: hypothetical protein FKN15_017785 [Acipenser sinensis]
MSASYCPLEDKCQPCKCLPEFTKRLASRVRCSAMRVSWMTNPSRIPNKDCVISQDRSASLCDDIRDTLHTMHGIFTLSRALPIDFHYDLSGTSPFADNESINKGLSSRA